jgi:hypothetical protein
MKFILLHKSGQRGILFESEMSPKFPRVSLDFQLVVLLHGGGGSSVRQGKMVTEHLGKLAAWKGEQCKWSFRDSVHVILHYPKIGILRSFIPSYSIYMFLGPPCEDVR